MFLGKQVFSVIKHLNALWRPSHPSVLVTATQNARSMRATMGCGTKNLKDNRCSYLALSGIRVDAVLSDGKFGETQ